MALFVSLFAPFMATNVSAANDEFDTARLRWKDNLTGGSGYDVNDPIVSAQLYSLSQTNWGTMNTSVTARTYLWSDLASPTNSSHVTQSYQRIKNMALAYSTPGTALYGNPQLKTDIIGALDWMYVNRYNETRAYYDNWWDWEIGSPLQLNDTVVLMYDDLIATPEKIANYMKPIERFSPVPQRVNYNQLDNTGANLVWKCNLIALRGIIVKDPAKIASARDGLSPVFDYVNVGDGFYEDGSFVQHTVFAYTGGYGVSLLQELGNALYMLKGSVWEVTDPDVNHMYEWIYNAYEPLIYNGAMMDMVRGRAIVRNYEQDHTTGHNTIAAIVRLAQMAPEADALRMKSMVKYWLQADTEFNYYSVVNLRIALWTQQIMEDASIEPRGEKLLSKIYAGMDRAVHLRPGFGIGLSMSSKRIGTHEATVGENLKGWYTGAGMTYLYNNHDLRQYYDFWPTVNKYRLPGTTVDTMTRSTANYEGTGYRSPNTFAGGSELLGETYTVGMDYKAYGSSLTAKKSWFMFDDEMVALGAGIYSSDSRTIETTIENRMLNKTQSFQGIDLLSPASASLGGEPVRLKVYAVSDSGNDGNLPENTIDNSFTTRWSSSGNGQWLQYDLGKTQTLGYAGISFMVQSTRTTQIDILVSTDNQTWSTAFSGSSSIVADDTIQVFDFPDVEARYVKIVGHGNSTNLWNSITEVQLYAPCAAGNLVIMPEVVPLSPVTVTDSTYSASYKSAIDNNITSYWSSYGSGQWVQFDMGSDVPIGHAGISFYQGTQTEYPFRIDTSLDGTVWSTVYSGFSIGRTAEIMPYDFADTTARYVKFVFDGDQLSSANRVSEIQLYAPNALGPVLNPLHSSKKAMGDEQFIVNGVSKPVNLGWMEDLNSVDYAYLEGTGGYYFPGSASIKAQRATSTGTWSEITAGGTTNPISKNYLTLWYDHGKSPTNKDYSYVLLPNKTAEETASYSANPDIEIIANNRNIQAVRERTQYIVGANFWEPGTVDRVTASDTSSITLKDQEGVLDVAVSDPTQLQSKLTFEIARNGLAVVEQDDSVTVLQLQPTIRFEVNTEQRNGHSHSIKFAYDTAVQTALPTPSPVPPVNPPAEPEPEILTTVDVLDDYTQVYARSSNLDFERGSPEYFNGDTSRAIRTTTNTNEEYLIYKAADNREMTSFDITTWFWSNEAKTDFQIYTSSDDITYTLYTPTKTTAVPRWTKVNYSGLLPEGTKFLKIVYALKSNYIWNPQIGEVRITSAIAPPTVPAVREITLEDSLNDFSNVFDRTATLKFESGYPQNFNGDESRIIRAAANTNGEYLTYKSPYGFDITSFDLTTWFYKWEAMTDFQIYTSPDNSAYTQFTPVKTVEVLSYNKVNYSGSLPAGTKYIKVVFMQKSAAYSWTAQIGEFKMTSKVPSITVRDEQNDFSIMYAHSNHLIFTGANAGHTGGDTSRLVRTTNTEEYVVYKAEPDMDMSQFAVKAWSWSYESTEDLQFLISADNVTYTPFAPTKSTTSGGWNEVDYTGTLPEGTQYLKIAFKPSPVNAWNPQIGRVDITSRITYP
jgi:hypothetical protein